MPPAAGGQLDQPAAFWEAFDVIESELQKLVAREQKRAADKAARPRKRGRRA